MRGVALLSVLIAIAIIAYMWSISGEASSKANREIRQEVAPITGRGEDGGTITDSADFQADRAGLLVSTVKPGSYFDTFFALKPGDVIVRAGDFDLRGTDQEMATIHVYEAAQKKRELVVMRNGQRVTLEVK